VAYDREYEQPPLDESDLDYWQYWWEYQVSVGNAAAFGPGRGGRPAGYREASPGRWRREGVDRDLPSVAAQHVLFTRDFLAAWGWEKFRTAWQGQRVWLTSWREEALQDRDVSGPLAEAAGVPDTWGPAELAVGTLSAAGCWQYLVGQPLPRGTVETPPPVRIDADVDPLRIAYGLDPPRRLFVEPFTAHTQRSVAVRDRFGHFTGRREVRAVPIVVIPHSTPLGSRVRVLDVDRGGKPPRGAIARIQTTAAQKKTKDQPGRRAKWAYIVPVDAAGKFPGSKLEDKRHAKRRADADAESLQLTDHRTGKLRELEILVTARSRNHATALEFAALFRGAQAGIEEKN
jgi:hypothetical protein